MHRLLRRLAATVPGHCVTIFIVGGAHSATTLNWGVPVWILTVAAALISLVLFFIVTGAISTFYGLSFSNGVRRDPGLGDGDDGDDDDPDDPIIVPDTPESLYERAR